MSTEAWVDGRGQERARRIQSGAIKYTLKRSLFVVAQDVGCAKSTEEWRRRKLLQIMCFSTLIYMCVDNSSDTPADKACCVGLREIESDISCLGRAIEVDNRLSWSFNTQHTAGDAESRRLIQVFVDFNQQSCRYITV